MVIRPPLHELAMAAKLSSSFLMLSHFRLREQGNTRHCHRCSLSGVSREPRSCSYFSLRLILVNSTKPASMGSVSSPAEIIRRQSSYVWSVTGTPRALQNSHNHINPMIYATFTPECIWLHCRLWSWGQHPYLRSHFGLRVGLISAQTQPCLVSIDSISCCFCAVRSCLRDCMFMPAGLKCAFKSSKRLLGHRLSHSAGKQSRGFLLLLSGDVWRQKL